MFRVLNQDHLLISYNRRYVVGTQKDCLGEIILLSTHNLRVFFFFE